MDGIMRAGALAVLLAAAAGTAAQEGSEAAGSDRQWAAPAVQPGERGAAKEPRNLRDWDIYGWQIMSQEERAAYWRKTRSFRTERALEDFRADHRRRMDERARALGVDLSDEALPSTPAMHPQRPDEDPAPVSGGPH